MSILGEAQAAFKEARSATTAWNDEALVDIRFYLSDQWKREDKEKLVKKGVPVLNLNYIKKTIDLVSGYQRQNRGDIKYYPIEGGDQLVSEVLSKIAHWTMKNNGSRYYVSEAFKEALITGIGWFYPVIDYSKDPLNGDIFLRHESSFNMLYDPHFNELDLSDCDYIIRQKLLSVKKAVELWPDHKKDIEDSKGVKGDQSFRQDANVPSDRGEQVLVWEYWRREYVNVKFAVNSQTGEMNEVDDEQVEQMVDVPEIEVLEKRVPRMKVAIIVGESTEAGQGIVVFDGDSPYNSQEYPFVPIFCYMTSSYSQWEQKLQGMIRTLRDPQREKNKRRSSAMQIISTIASSGYDIEKGAYDDINQFNKGGAGKVFLRNPGRNPAQRLAPPDLPASIITLEQMFDQDMNMMGANPDLLGMVSEKGAAGITIQLRQKQGMTALQEVFDNLTMSIQKFGRMLVEIIVENFSQDKIERILGEEVPYQKDIESLGKQIAGMTKQLEMGAKTLQQMNTRTVQGQEGREEEGMAQVDAMNQEEEMFEQQLMQMRAELEQAQMQMQQLQADQAEFWKRWEDLAVNSRYDCTVSEAIESETYRISVLSSLTQAMQYGMQVPPDLFMQYLDLPQDDKQKMSEFAQQQQQMQMEAQMAQNQSKIQLEQIKIQGKMAAEQGKAKNSKDIALINQGVITPETVQ